MAVGADLVGALDLGAVAVARTPGSSWAISSKIPPRSAGADHLPDLAAPKGTRASNEKAWEA